MRLSEAQLFKSWSFLRLHLEYNEGSKEVGMKIRTVEEDMNGVLSEAQLEVCTDLVSRRDLNSFGGLRSSG